MASEPKPRASQAHESPAIELLSEDFLRIVNVLYRAIREAAELRRFADDARDTDHELHSFFERCAFSQAERASEAQQLLASRSRTHQGEVVTSAAFAAGDGANDADVAPSSERRSVRLWPAQ